VRRKTLESDGVTIEKLCAKVGMTRQNYYKQRKARKRREVDEGLIVDLVNRERRLQPRIGCRKLYRMLSDELAQAGVEIGRDRMFEVLKKHDLLVPPLPKSPRTTNSRHSLPVFSNEIADVEPTGPNQIWVADITYLRTWEGFEYLTMIMDLWSHKIVGHFCSEELTAEASMKALERAIALLPEDAYPIHHSDRGCQFCSHDYVDLLESHGLTVSMTEINHCAENSHAERLNGIVKQEYYLGGTFLTREHARRAVEEAVWLYNNRRPHTSLGFEVPAEVHEKAA
jgi:transposase InsO family protein